ncbi:MAG: SusC/RagA family TonB-linked outer membrane protein [Muribaculaceae bacterium]|nr:SusC/RagA family TonB-linked outer membrane protein [Muribaculaceae bacterium]
MKRIILMMVSVMLCALGLYAQNRTYHGTVLDAANNEPLIGATIMPIGGGQGAAADIDGNFTLSVPSNVKKVTVTYVGYQSKTVDLTDGMTVYLDSSSTSLDDLVVVAYGTATKESLTGSVAVIGSKEIEDRPVTSVTSALEGNAPGVQVNSTVGMPGSSPTIRIRGFNSINGDNNPLYVVDGFPYNGSISDLNPADIESMTVLKDAASAALYGNKGANGVILITTKKGKSNGKIDVTLQIRQGMYTKGIPNYDRMKPNQWMEKSLEGIVNGGVSSASFADRESAMEYYRENFISAYALNNIYGVPDNELFNENGKLIPATYLPGYTDLDWWDAVSVKSGYRQEYNINAAAATEKFNVFASVGYLKEHGYTVNTDFERFNGRVNANFNPVSYLRFGVNLAATQQAQQYLDITGETDVNNIFLTQSMAPIYPYYRHDEAGNIIYDENGQPIWNTAGYLEGSNIGYTCRADKANLSATVVDGAMYGTAVLPYDFELTVRGSIHRDKTNQWSYTNNKMGSAAGIGMLYPQYAEYNTHTFMQELNWGHDYGLHHVDALLHHENTSYKSEGSAYLVANQQFQDIYSASNFTQFLSATGAIAEVHDESYLGRVRYNYNQKYFGEVSIREDGTSRFAKGNRWGTFWSIGASWVISKEKFMQDVMWVDYLKLRTAYGSVGNCMSASFYSYWPLYGQSNPYSGAYTLIPGQLASNNVRWEATKTFDIGIDGSLFNDRFSFTLGYFNKRNADLLFNVTQAASTGMTSNSGSNSSILTNIGTMENQGCEITLNGDIFRTRDFVWSLSFDATFYKNKVLKLPSGRNIYNGNRLLTEGKSMYEFYLIPYAGVDQLTGQSLYEIDKSSYDFYSYDANGNFLFNEDTYNSYVNGAREDGALVEYNGKLYTTRTQYAGRVLSGTSLPTMYGSFGTSLSWKGINFSALFTYGIGGKVLDSNYASYMNVGERPSAISTDMANSWQGAPEGMTADSPNRIDPKGVAQCNTYNSSDNFTSSSTQFLTSANYLVFKNLNVSYDLPMKWVNALKLQNINIGVSIDNLFTKSARRGLNPQQSFNGSQTITYVTPRVFSFQLSARF